MRTNAIRWICLLMLLIAAQAAAECSFMEIEDVWAIQDARTEASGALTESIASEGVLLPGVDGGSRFYYPLGLGQCDEWPGLSLEAGEGVSLCFEDDYMADSCADAIAAGTAYLAMAWTEKEYQEFEVVFTGFPMIMLNTEEEITTDDTAARIVFHSSEGVLDTWGRTHLRGDSTLANSMKHNYKLEFTDGSSSKKKSREIPGFMETDQVILLPMCFDNTLMRDRLSWAMAEKTMSSGAAFKARKCSYVELVVNGSYEGVYLLLEPYSIKDELALEGCEETDSVYRTALVSTRKKREMLEDERSPFMGYELFRTKNADAFAPLQEYLSLWTQAEDKEFADQASCLNLDSFLRYDLFVQATGQSDAFFNNMFLRAHTADGKTTYSCFLWDMDLSWGKSSGEGYANWFACPVADRLMELDVSGARSRTAELWQQMQADGMNEETILTLIGQYSAELRGSGAFDRNAERWPADDYDPDGYAIMDFVPTRLALLDSAIQLMNASGDSMDFLTAFYRDGSTGVIPETLE